jgi:rod shape-determining protein MreC
MRNILALIQRFYVFLLFLALQVLALAMLFSSNNFHKAEFINHSSDWVGSVYSQRARLSEYLRLDEINDELSLENAQLRSMLPESFASMRTRVDSIVDSVSFQRYSFRTAKIVNATVNREKNYLTLDRGSDSGVMPDMGVISNGGIVGIVRSVSRNFAIVMPVLHSSFKASVRLRKVGFQGALIWPGGDPSYADVMEIPRNVPIELGDTIVTTGHSSYFPANILVGTVAAIDDSDKDFHILKVKLKADFRRLDYVQVVSDILKDERENLENQIEQQDAANNPH